MATYGTANRIISIDMKQPVIAGCPNQLNQPSVDVTSEMRTAKLQYS